MSLDAVGALANASYRLFSNGTTRRSYGAQKREIHSESEFDVLVVNLESLHEPFSDKGFIDHLVFFSERAYERLWLGSCETGAKPLSHLCVQHALNSKPSKVSPHLSILEEHIGEFIVSAYDDRDMSNFSGYHHALLVRSFTHKEASFFELLRSHGMCACYQANSSCVYDEEMQLLGF